MFEVEIRRTSGNYLLDTKRTVKGRKKRWYRIFESKEEYAEFLGRIKDPFIVFNRTIRYKRKFPRTKDILVLQIWDGEPKAKKGFNNIWRDLIAGS